MPGLLYETSKLDPNRGIAYRGHDLYEILVRGQTTLKGGQPNPEGILWLLLTGKFPTEEEAEGLTRDLMSRAEIPAATEELIRSFPKSLHPMT